MVSIVNWESYQVENLEKKVKNTNQTPTKHQPNTTNNNDNNDNNIYTGSFLTFWGAYPRKKKKGDAFKAWKALRVNNGLLGTMIDAIKAQKKTLDWKKDGGQFIPYPATWLRARGWEDEIEMQDSYAPNPKTFKVANE